MKKALLAILLVIVLVLPLAGCSDMSPEQAMSMLATWLQGYSDNNEDEDDSDDEKIDPVTIALTYPAGRSPNVFTTGWVFGASCSANGKDYSSDVKWSGSGSFTPDTGNRSRPSFSAPGANTITLSVKIGTKSYSKSFNVNAVSPAGYASVGSLVQCSAYAMGCPGCPHTTVGPITTGSSQVLINGRGAARVGDVGINAGGCGPSEFKITTGDSSVLINGRSAAKIGLSRTSHSGGTGIVIGGGS